MYFGSVKFFKHLILTVVFGWIGVATILAVYFGVKCYNLEKESDPAAAENSSVEEYVSEMFAKGFSSEDILEYIRHTDKTAYDNFISADAVGESKPDKETATAPAADVTDVSLPASEEIISEQEIPVQAEPTEESDYTALYPELYAEKSTTRTAADGNTVYLAFEDGPSVNTWDILYILNRQNIKATFFMSAGKTESCTEQMAAVAEAGHTIGVHSFSHDTELIYSSVEAYLNDFYETYKLIYDATGVRASIYTFPQPESCSEQMREQIIKEMDRRGFTLVECNASSGDRSGDKSWQSILDTSLDSVAANMIQGRASVLHLHDSADDYITVLTTEDIIKELKKDGYTFAALDNSVEIK